MVCHFQHALVMSYLTAGSDQPGHGPVNRRLRKSLLSQPSPCTSVLVLPSVILSHYLPVFGLLLNSSKIFATSAYFLLNIYQVDIVLF